MALKFAEIEQYIDPKKKNKRQEALDQSLSEGIDALTQMEEDKKAKKAEMDAQSSLANAIPSEEKVTVLTKRPKKGLNKRQEAMLA